MHIRPYQTSTMLRILPLRQTASHIVRSHYTPITRSFHQNAICLRQPRVPTTKPTNTKNKSFAQPLFDLLRGAAPKDLKWMDKSKKERKERESSYIFIYF